MTEGKVESGHDDLIRTLIDVLPTYGNGEREWIQAEAVLKVMPELAGVLDYTPTADVRELVEAAKWYDKRWQAIKERGLLSGNPSDRRDYFALEDIQVAHNEFLDALASFIAKHPTPEEAE